MVDVLDSVPDPEDWRTYEEFAAGNDTYRLPNVDLTGRAVSLTLDEGSSIALAFGSDTVTWQAAGSLAVQPGTHDPYDAVAVRDDVFFVNLPRMSVDREALTVVYSTTTNRAVVVRSVIGQEDPEGVPRVHQTFFAGTTDTGPPSGLVPGPSRDLIGKRNVYRYSPAHHYEHIYVFSQRYACQCLQGVQRGHGDMDLSTAWKLHDGLYVFCFREFRIAVASVWLHDLGYQLMTTGISLGLTGGRAEHSRAGGHSYPLGSVSYPDAQPV